MDRISNKNLRGVIRLRNHSTESLVGSVQQPKALIINSPWHSGITDGRTGLTSWGMGQGACYKLCFCSLKNLPCVSYSAKEILDCRETNDGSLAGIKVQDRYCGILFLVLYFLAALAEW